MRKRKKEYKFDKIICRIEESNKNKLIKYAKKKKFQNLSEFIYTTLMQTIQSE